MRKQEKITFIVAVNKRDVLEANFLASPCFQSPHEHQILLQEGFPSAALAYNDAIDKSVNELIVLCHQDMYFPSAWTSQLQSAIDRLEGQKAPWGVLGCSGVTEEKQYFGHIYSAGVGIIGQNSEPVEVQTLDEIVLVIKKSSGLRFDEKLPSFHLYGSDICLEAARKALKSYAISAFCIHNTLQSYMLPNEFYDCCAYVRRKWAKALPIQTTCIRITRRNLPIYGRRLREAAAGLIRRRPDKHTRVDDVAVILQELSNVLSRT